MDDCPVGCPSPRCPNVLKRTTINDWRNRRCDNCKERFDDAPYICARCDIDYCELCYRLKKSTLWGLQSESQGPTRRRMVEPEHQAPPSVRKRARFEPAEEEDDQGGGEEQVISPRRIALAASACAGSRRPLHVCSQPHARTDYICGSVTSQRVRARSPPP
mgnify:CR=1 FL=1|jgi:hypothetical protein